jgi:hypothetical protein
MPSRKPCKKLCGSTKICNPNSGRCVDRNGAVGRSVLNAPKKKRKDKSSRFAKIKTDKSRKGIKKSRKSSPFHALGPDVLRYKIKPYLGASSCETLTKKFGCKGTMSVFTDGEGNRMDCALYCLSKCSPGNLMPLFNTPTHAFFEQNNQQISVPIANWEFSFEKYRYGYPRVIAETSVVIIRKGKSPGKIFISYDTVHNQSVSNLTAAKTLCEFMKNILKSDSVSFTAVVSLGPFSNLRGNEKFVRFDHSWLRPTSEWNLSRTPFVQALTTNMEIESEITGKGLKI